MTNQNDKYKNLNGKKFNRLTIIDCQKSTKVKVVCDCGTEKTINKLSHILNGDTKSCGCLYREGRGETFRTHGHAQHKNHSPTYISWKGMLIRCRSKRERYAAWQGRGIKVCQRWQDSFQNFLDDMGERPSSKHSLDRIDNDGDYCPENCRWVTQKEQNRNSSRNTIMHYGGKSLCVADWADILGINYNTLLTRKVNGWSDEKAIETPVSKYQSATARITRR